MIRGVIDTLGIMKPIFNQTFVHKYLNKTSHSHLGFCSITQYAMQFFMKGCYLFSLQHLEKSNTRDKKIKNCLKSQKGNLTTLKFVKTSRNAKKLSIAPALMHILPFSVNVFKAGENQPTKNSFSKLKLWIIIAACFKIEYIIHSAPENLKWEVGLVKFKRCLW